MIKYYARFWDLKLFSSNIEFSFKNSNPKYRKLNFFYVLKKSAAPHADIERLNNHGIIHKSYNGSTTI